MGGAPGVCDPDTRLLQTDRSATKEPGTYSSGSCTSGTRQTVVQRSSARQFSIRRSVIEGDVTHEPAAFPERPP